MVEICQQYLPILPWENNHGRRLPGLNPIVSGEWLLQDDAYCAQMAYRVTLMASKALSVHQLSESAYPAAQELLDCVLKELRVTDGFEVCANYVICPDNRQVEIDYNQPLLTCGALVQEDFAIMEKQGDEHVLTGAIICFPASWSLDQKYMQPMTRIHTPVVAYTKDIARRVQRLFDGIQVGHPMWRANHFVYDDPELHQPRREEAKRVPGNGGPKWLRVERQGMRRLEKTNAVVFSIHTYVLSDARLIDLGIDLSEISDCYAPSM